MEDLTAQRLAGISWVCGDGHIAIMMTNSYHLVSGTVSNPLPGMFNLIHTKTGETGVLIVPILQKLRWSEVKPHT